jgi:hypothetical protein
MGGEVREVSFASTAKRNPSSKAEVLPPSLHSLLSSLYYRRERARLPFCPSTLHALTHLAHYVRLFRPPSSYWAFVMERFCGILKPHLASKVRSTENLIKYVVFLEQVRTSVRFRSHSFLSSRSSRLLFSCHVDRRDLQQKAKLRIHPTLRLPPLPLLQCRLHRPLLFMRLYPSLSSS